MVAAALPTRQPADADDIRVTRGLTWDDFEAALAARGEHATPRLAFLDGALEAMSPSRNHEAIKSQITRLLLAWTDAQGLDLEAFGAWTLKRADLARAIEPDDCFVLGVRETSVPDLAIEVVWTHGGVDKHAIYAALGVPELWTWRDGVLTVRVLRGGAYGVVPRSALLPALDLDAMRPFIEVANQSAAVRAWRALLAAR